MKKKKIVAMIAAGLLVIMEEPMKTSAVDFEDIFEQGYEDQQNQGYEDAYEDLMGDDSNDLILWPGLYYCTYSDDNRMLDPSPSIELMIEKNDYGVYATMYDYRAYCYVLTYSEMYIDGPFMNDTSGSNSFTYDIDKGCIYLESVFYYGELTFWPVDTYSEADFNVKYYYDHFNLDYSGIYYSDATGVIVKIFPMYNSAEYYVDINGSATVLHPTQGSNYTEEWLGASFWPQSDKIDSDYSSHGVKIYLADDGIIVEVINIQTGNTEYPCIRIGDVGGIENYAGTWSDGNGHELVITDEDMSICTSGEIEWNMPVELIQYYHDSGYTDGDRIFWIDMNDTEIYMEDLDNTDKPMVFFRE